MLNKFIVFYGCDNSGKTTATFQAKKILEDFGFSTKVVHSCGPGDDKQLLEFMKHNMDCRNSFEKVVLFDRFPAIEEFVYGPIVRGRSVLDGHIEECNKYMNLISLFIHCNPSRSIISNWGSRNQMSGVKENYDKILDAYDTEVVKRYPAIKNKIVEYDWTKSKGNDALKNIIKEWLRNEYHTR